MTGLKTEFPADWHDRWREAHQRIDHAGYGELVASAYRKCGPVLAGRVGPDFAVRLGRTVSTVAIKSGRRAALVLIEAAWEISGLATDSAQTRSWLDAVDSVARQAPDALSAMLSNTTRIVRELGFDGFQTFVRMGLALSLDDRGRRRAFFALESGEARQALEYRSGSQSLSEKIPQLKHYYTALWGFSPPVAAAPADAPEPMRRRAGFGGGGIRLPVAFAGFTDTDQKALYRAALAHIGAHHRYSREKFAAKGLKPLQIALVSLIEDARVERLATAAMPGLQSLWGRFHIARAEGAPIAINLMARLSRALNDPSYSDSHGWVEKGCSLFSEAMSTDITDQLLSRRIGGLLGNDLGQMRLQFDAKTYVVQPAYRDDNLALWDFGEEQENAIEIEAMAEGARIDKRDEADGRREEGAGEEEKAGKLSEARPDEGVIVARYHEYDYVTGSLRPNWCTVREVSGKLASEKSLAALRDSRSDVVERITALINASRVSRQERTRRQPEGEFLDTDAAISAMIAFRNGEAPDTRIYGRYERRSRDMSVLVLIDASYSTNDLVREGGKSVLSTEKLAGAFLARAMAGLGDPFAMAAFCSDTREDVRYLRIKDFQSPFNDYSLARLAGLEGALSTRLGAVIRHAGQEIAGQSTYRRLVLVITDGEPSDVDVEDKRFLVEDARAAVHELNREGIDVFGVLLDSEAESYASRIFGKRNSVLIGSAEKLPEALPLIYLRLAR
ncbi:MAG: hypothetical protein KF874_04260 [Rhizobiaceae bacterium]|nr:hypothetical protein [Rhizobiaceae bacterium]